MTLRSDALTWLGSAISTLAILGAFIGWLPYVAALAALIWYIIQIWESRTIQEWYIRRAVVRRARQIARLQAKEKLIAAKLEALHTVRVAKQTAQDIVHHATIEAAAITTKKETEIVKFTPPKV